MNVTGMIDLQTCAKVVAESYQEYLLPLGVITIIALFAGMIIKTISNIVYERRPL